MGQYNIYAPNDNTKFALAMKLNSSRRECTCMTVDFSTSPATVTIQAGSWIYGGDTYSGSNYAVVYFDADETFQMTDTGHYFINVNRSGIDGTFSLSSSATYDNIYSIGWFIDQATETYFDLKTKPLYNSSSGAFFAARGLTRYTGLKHYRVSRVGQPDIVVTGNIGTGFPTLEYSTNNLTSHNDGIKKIWLTCNVRVTGVPALTGANYIRFELTDNSLVSCVAAWVKYDGRSDYDVTFSGLAVTTKFPLTPAPAYYPQLNIYRSVSGFTIVAANTWATATVIE